MACAKRPGLLTDLASPYTVAKRDIEELFPEEESKAMEKSLQRMVADGLLIRATRGIYGNPLARSKSGRVIEETLPRHYGRATSRMSVWSRFDCPKQVLHFGPDAEGQRQQNSR